MNFCRFVVHDQLTFMLVPITFGLKKLVTENWSYCSKYKIKSAILMFVHVAIFSRSYEDNLLVLRIQISGKMGLLNQT